MQISLSRLSLVKRHALTISRGTNQGSENLIVTVDHEGITGIGEMAPSSGGATPDTADNAARFLESLQEGCQTLTPWDIQEWEERWKATQPNSSGACAALDMALHDWMGKRLNVPVWRLFGLDRERIVPTSVTIGINPPEIVREILPEIVARTQARILKVKLGSPQGIEADKAMFAAAQEACVPEITWRVDANGGWTVEAAQQMIRWLAARDVEFVEQPLPRGQERDLPAIHKDSPLPIYVDESVYHASDIPPLAPYIEGVNLKLMKSGGIREAIRIIHTARACHLKVMIGCMSESALAITAAAQISPLVDMLDLDSHLNLKNDPFVGAVWRDGRVLPNDLPGLGVTYQQAGNDNKP
ncbi:MAG: Mandelate racemase/muconate lactonizing protein [Chthonomonadaceae bacterium]|nr:Mandelate racemase/muconate lactonizing protein [Chthonomonadaceae bacterium]